MAATAATYLPGEASAVPEEQQPLGWRHDGGSEYTIHCAPGPGVGNPMTSIHTCHLDDVPTYPSSSAREENRRCVRGLGRTLRAYIAEIRLQRAWWEHQAGREYS